MSTMAFQITGISIVLSTVCSGADQRKHQSPASLAFVRGMHRWPVNSSHKGPVPRKCFLLMTSSCIYPCPAFNGSFVNTGFTNGAVGWVIASNSLIRPRLRPCPHRTQNHQCYGLCYAVNILTGIGLTKQRAKFRKALMIFCVTGPLCGEFTGHRWIPLTKASYAELRCFLWYAPEQTVEQTIETPMIWDTIAPIRASLRCAKSLGLIIL